MTQLLKPGQRPFNFKGISLVELAFFMVVLTIIIVSVVGISLSVINKSKATRTINEMDVLANSCRQYYSVNSAWPGSLNVLYPDFTKRASFVNVFGNNYDLLTTSKTVSISSNIPKGLVTQNIFGDQLVVVPAGVWDKIVLTKELPDEGLDSLIYDKKYIYKN
jgi:type II secretory pathway pseudopilin PulG